MTPLTALDFYKTDHRRQYPEGTELIYSNLTPRSGKLSNLPEQYNDQRVVFFGLQYFIKKFLIESWNEEFFWHPKERVITAYKKRMDTSLGSDAIDVSHIEELHDLGYLPIEIRALPEGMAVPYKVPMLTIHNTLPRFFWLTNYLETVMSAWLWKPCTTATTARWYRKALSEAATVTGAPLDFVDFQAHDFSMRGMSGLDDAALSGAAHLLFFKGTDVVPAIDLLEQYYGAKPEQELIGCSVPATEHSVMCMGGKETEKETFLRLITKVYPTSIVSIVSDTWDFWNTCTNTMQELKDVIMQRDGKLVIRPDSGDPVKIICGDNDAEEGTPEHKGAIQCLWDIFGGTTTDNGFKVLDEHIGLIYGDSITPQRTLDIIAGLSAKGFASSNVVLGVGSYTYQYVTRDTHGFAVKSTYGVINGVGHNISKSPKTDNGVKKSAEGLLYVSADLQLTDKMEWCELERSMLQPVFKDGVLLREQTLSEIRKVAHPPQPR